MILLSTFDLWDSNIRVAAAALGWPAEGVLRLLLAALAGGLVGLEREIRGRQAGFRTNLLVCLGSALAMIVSIRFAAFPWQASPGVNINVDPARIAYGVMAGVGFLGAGAILHSGSGIRGLTTAAALWCVAAVGLSVGFGQYVISVAATTLILCALWFLDYVEELLPRQRLRTIVLRARYHPGCVKEVVEKANSTGVTVLDADFHRIGDLSDADITLQIVFNRLQCYRALEASLEKDERYQLLAMKTL